MLYTSKMMFYISKKYNWSTSQTLKTVWDESFGRRGRQDTNSPNLIRLLEGSPLRNGGVTQTTWAHEKEESCRALKQVTFNPPPAVSQRLSTARRRQHKGQEETEGHTCKHNWVYIPEPPATVGCVSTVCPLNDLLTLYSWASQVEILPFFP